MNYLVMGAPGAGKTTFCRENLGAGVMYDLDLIATALRGNRELDPDDPRSRTFNDDARDIADQLLVPMIEAARRVRPTSFFLIRTAPTLEEVEALMPDQVFWIRSIAAEVRCGDRMYEKLERTADMIERAGYPVRHFTPCIEA